MRHNSVGRMRSNNHASGRSSLLLVLLYSILAVADEDLAAIEEAVALPQGFSPRFFEGASPLQPFVKRQDTGVCPDGGHSCSEIGAAGQCCAVDKYCYYKSDWEVGCCGFGTTCDPQCTGTSYRTNATQVVTTNTTLPASTTGSGATGTIEESVFTTTFVGCKGRACPVSQYQCPQSMGGNCCDNSQVCASNNQCISTISSTPTLVATRGCSGTPSATDCPSDGGCCLKGATCISIDGTLGCTGTPDGPSGSNITTTSEPLSQGAKAGIGAGVAIGAAIVIGLLTWFCIRRRREARSAGNRNGTRATTPGPDESVAGGAVAVSENSAAAGRHRHRNGLAYQYLGPTAGVGPYTQQEELHGDITPGLSERGVPRNPQGPNDVRAPVEMGDSSSMVGAASMKTGATDQSRGPPQASPEGEVYELAAPWPEPSPMSPEEYATPQSHTPGSASVVSPTGGTMKIDDYIGKDWQEPKPGNGP